jgi:hypothetical protein
MLYRFPLKGNLLKGGKFLILDKISEHHLFLRIAAIVIQAIPAEPGFYLQLDPAHEFFRIDETPPHITFSYHYGRVPEVSGDLLFDSGGLWKWYRRDDANLISIAFPTFPDAPFRVAILNAKLSRAEVFIQDLRACLVKPEVRYHQGAVILNPFEYPLDEVVLVHYLAQGRGVLVHACGIRHENQGLLFAGVSGAGKSTLAELWKKTGAWVLSDDRIVIRPGLGGFTMYGTPWHGDALTSRPESAPLKKIFFLEKAAGNYARELPPSDAAARLVVRCFPPFYDQEAMAFIVNLVGRIAEEVPCFELGFAPDKSVVNFVEGLV